MSMQFKNIILLLIFNLIYSQDDITTEKTFKICREQKQLIGSNKTEQYELIEFEINETMILECHYCGKNDDNKPKNWFTINPNNLTYHKVSLDMHNNDILNRISVSLDHELIIRRMLLKDTGIYFCRNLQESETENFLNYIVEISFNKTKNILKGNIENWKEYHKDYIEPLNKKLMTSNDDEFLFLRETLATNFEIITHWEIKYRPCQACGRPQGEGIQEKYGYCRIKIENEMNLNSEDLLNINLPLNKINNFKYLLNLPQISCNSQLLKESFPKISELTFNLSDFTLIKKCNAICNPDAAGVNRGWKFGSSKNFKYKRTIVLKEGEHIALICPESNLDNTIIWRRNGKVISQSETDKTVNQKNIEEIHIVVDAFNSLYLLHVTPEESGNYTCQVDKILMQQIRIYVKSHSRLRTEVFFRHLIYLAVILVLSCSCYVAGCIAACARKNTFKRYDEIVNEII